MAGINFDFTQSGNAESTREMIRELRRKTQAAGFYFPDSPVDLKTALTMAQPLIESQQAAQKAEAETQTMASQATGQARGLFETALPTLQGALEKFHSPDVVARAKAAIPASGLQPQQGGMLTLARALEASKQPLTQEGFTSAVTGGKRSIDTNLSALDLIARELGLENAASANPRQAMNINAIAQKRAAELSGQKAGAVETGKFSAAQKLPLEEKAAFWIDPKTGDMAKADDTPEDVKKKGFVPITQSGLGASSTAKAALAQLREYRELSNKLLVKQSGSTAMDIANIKSNQLKLSVLRQAGDPDAKRLEALFGAIATLARATGDTANIAVAEREFLKNFVPTTDDTIESAIAKADQAERILEAVVKGHGIPVPKTNKPDPLGIR